MEGLNQRSLPTRATTAVSLNRYRPAGRMAVLKPEFVALRPEFLEQRQDVRARIPHPPKPPSPEESENDDGAEVEVKGTAKSRLIPAAALSRLVQKMKAAHQQQQHPAGPAQTQQAVRNVRPPQFLPEVAAAGPVPHRDQADYYLKARREANQLGSEDGPLSMFPNGTRRKWPDPLFFRLKEWFFSGLRVGTHGSSPRGSRQYEAPAGHSGGACHCDMSDEELNRLVADVGVALATTSSVERLTLAHLPLESPDNLPAASGHSCDEEDEEVFDPRHHARLYSICYQGVSLTPSRLTSLTLTLCKISNAGCVVFSEWLSLWCPESLREIDLSHNSFGKLGVEALCVALKGQGHVTTLSLHGNALCDESRDEVCDLIASCRGLKYLDLGFTQLTNGVAKELFQAVTHTGLVYLALEGMRINSDASLLLLTAVTANKSLQGMSLRFNAACSSHKFTDRLEAAFSRNRLLEQQRLASGTSASPQHSPTASYFDFADDDDLGPSYSMTWRARYHKYTTNEPTAAPWSVASRLRVQGVGRMSSKSSVSLPPL